MLDHGKARAGDWVHICRLGDGKVARFDELADTYRELPAGRARP